MGVELLSTGASLGELMVENRIVEDSCGLPSGWIVEKTGISQRFVVTETQSTLTLARSALQMALRRASVSISDLDQLVVATYAHEKVFPSLASHLLEPNKTTRTQALDIQSNCTGFINALCIVHDRLQVDDGASVSAVVASEVNSRFVDPRDQNTAVYFSDGAGAAVLKRTKRDCGILSRSFASDTNNSETVQLLRNEEGDAIVRENSRPGVMRQAGIGTWKQAVTNIPRVVEATLSRAGLEISDVDRFIFHQPNAKLLSYITQKMKIDPKKAPINVDHVGNCGAASIPVVLNSSVEREEIHQDDLVLFVGIGAGFNFAAVLWRF